MATLCSRTHKSNLAAIALLWALSFPVAAGGVELRKAALLPAGQPVLQNGSGTIRMIDAHFGTVGRSVFVPEPGVLWQLIFGVSGLALIQRRRFVRHDRANIPRSFHANGQAIMEIL